MSLAQTFMLFVGWLIGLGLAVIVIAIQGTRADHKRFGQLKGKR